jgi:protein O-mannosyl-transferase
MPKDRKYDLEVLHPMNGYKTVRKHRLSWLRAGSPSDKIFFLYSVFLISLLTIVVYSGSLRNGFTNWDDGSLVLTNQSIRSLSADNLKKIFTPRIGSTYQPVRVVSYAIDYYFWELAPLGYHIVNTTLHGLSAIVLYLVLVHVLNQLRDKEHHRSSRLISLFTALLFAVHPVNVESVAWISSRKYGLLALFSFLSLYLYIRSLEDTGRRLHFSVPALISMLLAMLSSPFAVTLPLLFVLYDYCRDESNNVFSIFRKRVWFYIPLVVAGILALTLLWKTLESSRALDSFESNPLRGPVFTLLTMLRVLFDYIRNLILPIWLNCRYVNHISISIFDYKILTSASAVVIIFLLIFLQARNKNKLPLFCIGWFFICLTPVSNFIPISTMMADRYLYLPAVGLFLGFSLIVAKFSDLLALTNKPNILTLIRILLLGLFSAIAYQRCKIWDNSIALWKDSVNKDPLNYLAHNNLGGALFDKNRMAEAITHYQKAVEIKPDYVEALNNLGGALLKSGNLQASMQYLRKALQLRPDYAEANNNLGKNLADQGKIEDAIQYFDKALQIRPEYVNAHNNLGNALQKDGKISQAIHHYRQALKIKPDYAKAHNNLGNALLKQGKISQAAHHYNKALKIKPDYAETYLNLGVLRHKQGRINEAVHLYNKALTLRADFAEAHNNLGKACDQLGDREKAIDHYSQALRLRPEYQDARLNLEKAREMLENNVKMLPIEAP